MIIMFKKNKDLDFSPDESLISGNLDQEVDDDIGLEEIKDMHHLVLKELRQQYKKERDIINQKYQDKIKEINEMYFELPINKKWIKKKEKQLKGQTYEDYLLRKRFQEDEQKKYDLEQKNTLIFKERFKQRMELENVSRTSAD